MKNTLITRLANTITSGYIYELEAEIRVLKTELTHKQEVINQTNAYWKKKLEQSQRKQHEGQQQAKKPAQKKYKPGKSQNGL